MSQFEKYLNRIRITESFDDQTLNKHIQGFLAKYGIDYKQNTASILEYLQNNDEDRSSSKYVKQLYDALGNVNESVNVKELTNILTAYTKYLFDDGHMKHYLDHERHTKGLVDTFIQQNREMINESYNMMVVKIPPTDQWMDIQLTGIDGDTCKGFKYFDKTYCIRPKDLQFFIDNTGKDVKFKYLNTQGTKYMEFPVLVNESLNKHIINQELKKRATVRKRESDALLNDIKLSDDNIISILNGIKNKKYDVIGNMDKLKKLQKDGYIRNPNSVENASSFSFPFYLTKKGEIFISKK